MVTCPLAPSTSHLISGSGSAARRRQRRVEGHNPGTNWKHLLDALTVLLNYLVNNYLVLKSNIRN